MLLDTAGIPAGERVDVVASAVADLGIGCSVSHERDAAVYARLEVQAFGVASTFTYAGSGIRMAQTERQTRVAASEVLAVAVQGRRPGAYTQYERQTWLRPGDLLLIDHTAPYDYRWHGDGGAASVNVSLDELGLPVETVRRAAVQLAASPLLAAVGTHVRAMCSDATRLAADPGALHLGAATLELVRALVITAAAAEEPGARPASRGADGS